ncbi:MAG: hypothetical protein ACK5YU_08415 [Burkholderiales bacterium]|nr:hypothetical protein [Betaproteobacteria bacterium]
MTHQFDEGNQTRWFSFEEEGGHSYCLEAVHGPLSPVTLDPTITAYTSAAGTTALTSMVSNAAVQSTPAAGAPDRLKGARVCYIAPATAGSTVIRTFKVNAPASSGDAAFLRIRVVNTALYLNGVQVNRTNNSSLPGQSCWFYLIAENISSLPVRIRYSIPVAGSTI